jgi:hypothetical protein
MTVMQFPYINNYNSNKFTEWQKVMMMMMMMMMMISFKKFDIYF